MKNDTFIVIGLGNIGSNYEKTWHNLGFRVLSNFINKEKITCNKFQFKGLLGSTLINGKKVIAFFPQTFMNNSGEAVSEILNYYKIPPSNILVIFDDIDINWGKIRIREKGSSGTHNGMRSIVNHLGHQNFPRLRIGMGPKPNNYHLADFVLAKIDSSSEKKWQTIADISHEVILEWINNGIHKAQDFLTRRFNELSIN